MVRPCVARGFPRSVGIAVLHQCIRPLIGAVCAPGHHGYQRACVLLSGQVSMDHSGHQCSHAPGRPILHLVLSSRRPRRETGLCHRLLLFSSFVRAMRPFLRPGLPLFGASRAGAVKTGRSLRPPVGLGLDGPEHGATLKQIGTPSRASSCIRMGAPCGERPKRSVPAYWRARSPAHCGAIFSWRHRSRS